MLIDGRDIRDRTLHSLRHLITVVPQDVALFHRAIGENIRYGCPDATDREVAEAARLANGEGFVAAFPEGYATPVGDRGVALSGEQPQQVAIARPILRQPCIALDHQSETAVRLALTEVMRRRTIIAIARELDSLAGSTV
ncbi:ATP-binding cassette domain-containing protein [Inquilinus limosus]|uniref:ATP-binding cassette domain-containing protein n=1 Tax=Inquilinus limosus TaxID=171674 RepID=UPI003F13B0A2